MSCAKKHAMEMLLTGDPINAKYAKEIGLIKEYIKESILNGKIGNSHKEAKKLMLKKGKSLGLIINE